MQHPTEVVAPLPDERRKENRHQIFRGRKGHEPKQPTYFATQAAAVDEDEPFAAFGVLVGELHGHSPAKGVAHDGGPGHAEDTEQIPQAAGVGAERIVPRQAWPIDRARSGQER